MTKSSKLNFLYPVVPSLTPIPNKANKGRQRPTKESKSVSIFDRCHSSRHTVKLANWSWQTNSLSGRVMPWQCKGKIIWRERIWFVSRCEHRDRWETTIGYLREAPPYKKAHFQRGGEGRSKIMLQIFYHCKWLFGNIKDFSRAEISQIEAKIV